MTHRWRALGIAAVLLAAGCSAEPSSPPKAAYLNNGCAACHGSGREGTSLGPALDHSEGDTVQLEGGAEATYGSDYVRRAIVEPSAELTLGWPNTMTKMQLSDEEIDLIVEYLLTP